MINENRRVKIDLRTGIDTLSYLLYNKNTHVRAWARERLIAKRSLGVLEFDQRFGGQTFACGAGIWRFVMSMKTGR